MICRLCTATATYEGYDGDPDDPASSIIQVCGQHSTTDDVRIN